MKNALAAIGSALRRRIAPAAAPVPACEGGRAPAAPSRAERERDGFFAVSLDLLCIVDPEGRAYRVNPAFTRVLGWTQEELLSRNLLDLVHPDDVPGSRATLLHATAGEAVQGFSNRLRRHDGGWRRIQWSALRQPDGLLLATGRDVTEQYHASQRQAELNAQLALRVREREEAIATLDATNQELQAILDHVADCVVTFDSSGVVRRVNEAIRPLFGYAPSEVLGQDFYRLLGTPAAAAGAAAGGPPVGEPRQLAGLRTEVQGWHKAGHALSLELRLSEYAVDGESFYVAILRDVREHKQMIASLTEAREDALQASRAKSAFLATMSHEIRTPMNGVVGLIDVLAQDPLTERQSELVETVRDCAANLLTLIDDILDFSKIEAGRLELERTPVDLIALLRRVCLAMEPLARARGVALQRTVAPDVPRWILADEVRLRQVLGNLLSNAVKFSGGRPGIQGKVHVRVGVVQDDMACLAVAVEDNGIGIDGAQLPRLFRPFTQAESSTARRFGGTGLGLAICRRLADLMGGEIRVASAPGAGSTFTLAVPLTLAPPGVDDAAVDRPPAAGGELAREQLAGRILVVEDDAVNQQVLRHQLTLLGHAFEIVGDGNEALHLWQQRQFDVVLTDLSMPGMDGYELARRIRQEEGGAGRVPIVALTAHVLRGDDARGQAAGIDECLVKPIRLQALQALLQRYLRARPAAAAPAAHAGEAPAGAEPLFDARGLRELFAGNEAMVHDTLRDYCDALGPQALELIAALGRQDLAAAGALAHRLKSSSRAVGACRVGAICAAVEEAARDADADGAAAAAATLRETAAATRAQAWQLLRGNPGEKADVPHDIDRR